LFFFFGSWFAYGFSNFHPDISVCKKNIQISAVIPTYNREKTIARAIDSVHAQDYPATLYNNRL